MQIYPPPLFDYTRTESRNRSGTKSCTHDVDDELSRALVLQVLQTCKEVLLEIVERIAREATKSKHASLFVIKHVELNDRRAAWERVARSQPGRQHDVRLGLQVEHDVQEVLALLRGSRHGGLTELVRRVLAERAAFGRAFVVVVEAVRGVDGLAVVLAELVRVGELHAARAEPRTVGELWPRCV